MLLLDEDNDKDEDVDATDRGTSKRHYVWDCGSKTYRD